MGAGAKPGERRGGRVKGTRNHASIARQEEIARTGATPLDVMIKRMRYHHNRAQRLLKKDSADPAEIAKELALANDAAKDAAPFVHPKLAQVALQHDMSDPLKQLFATLCGTSVRPGDDDD